MPINIPQSSLPPLQPLTNKRILVTGGAGFVGTHICELLLLINAHVTVFDVAQPKRPVDKVKYVTGDLTSYNDVQAALANHDAVIHTASPSPISKNADLFNRVNVGGTQNIVDACMHHKITTLVYTSSASVVFDGTDQMNLDETAPVPVNKLDSYTTTKLAAEQLILAADCDKLHTCALRPHGIFGAYPMDPYAITGMTNAGVQGKSKFMFGQGNNIVDWTCVENVAYAHVLAAAVLLTQSNKHANGQAYFITNAQPAHFWSLPCNIYQALNVPTPYIQLPAGVMRAVATQWEAVGRQIPMLKPPTSFTAQAVIYGSTHHYYNCSKAQQHLGYIPPVTLEEGYRRVAESVKHLRKPTAPASRHITGSTLYGTAFILLIALFVLGSHTAQSVALFTASMLIYRLYRTSTFGESVNMAEADIDLSGKTVLLTGGNKGIGFSTALGLCKRGAHVYIATRDAKRGNDAVKQMKQLYTDAKIDRLELDLSSFDSVGKLVDTLKQRSITVDILVCNAAAMTESYQTSDKLDGQFQSNYLSHVLLCILLIHQHVLSMKARIVHVSSLMHTVGRWPIDEKYITGTDRSYVRLQMYNNTKLYQVMFNAKLAQLLKRHAEYTNITTMAVHPGACNTEFIDHFIPVWFHTAGNMIINSMVARTAEQGSETVIYSACARQLNGLTGLYIDNCEPRLPADKATDSALVESLWKTSVRLCGSHMPKDCKLVQ